MIRMSTNVINTLQEEEEEVRSLLLRHQKRIMLDLSNTDLIPVLVKNDVLTQSEADILLQPYALTAACTSIENALLTPDGTSNTKRLLSAVVSNTSTISTNSNSNSNSSNSAVNCSELIGDNVHSRNANEMVVNSNVQVSTCDSRDCVSPNPYEKIDEVYAPTLQIDESKLLQLQCSNLINIIAKSGFQKFKQFCYSIESECPQLIDDLINDRLKCDDDLDVEEKISEKENLIIDSMGKEEDINVSTLSRAVSNSPHTLNEIKHSVIPLSSEQQQNTEQPSLINSPTIKSKFPQSEYNLMQKNDSNAILIAPSQYQAKNFQANIPTASSDSNYSSLLCHTKSTTSPLTVRKREKLLHRFSDAATLGRKLKRKKNNRTCRSMTEPIEILADPVIEDEFFGDRTTWEYHTVSITRVPGYGFGIAVSGGRDNPHFANGDPSIAVSDVLRSGPAEDRLQVNDRIISVNGVSLENVEYATAVQVLRDSGNTVTLVLKRRVNCNTISGTNFPSTVGVGVNSITHSNSNFVASTNSTNITQPNSLNSSFAHGSNNTQPIKVTLTKNSKKEDYGIVIGCRLFIKEITSKAREQLTSNGYTLQEGDTITRIHNTNCGDTMSLKEAKKIIDGCKERLNLVVLRDITNQSSNPNLFSADSNAQRNVYNHHQQVSNCTNNLDGSYANGGNSYSSQNLYVQPPSRLMANGSSNGLNDEKNNLTPRGRSRGPIIDNLALQQLERPPTPPNACAARNRLEGPQRPPPIKGAAIDNEDSFYSSRRQLYADDSLSRRRQSLEPRFISFQKEGSVGIRLTGGNEAGIFVTAVQPGSPASLQGLMPGDKILKVNDMDMHGVTREEAVLFLLSLQDRIDLIVQYRKTDYDEVVNNHHGDSFHIKTHFHCENPLKGEIAFKAGDVFRVIDTLHNGVVGSWQVLKIGHGHQEMQRGVIPNKARAEELATAQFNASKKEMSANESRGNFFRRRKSTHRRSKSLSRENWDDVVFSDSISKFPAYERVVLRHPGFVRPVVIFGPISDLARDKLAKEFPDKFSIPLQSDEVKNSKCRIVRLSNIRDIMDSGKHALLDITPNAVDRLNYAQFYPIVVFLKTESKHVIKQLRHGIPKSAHKSSKKLLEQCQKLDQIWSHIFSTQILLNDEDTWYRKLREGIDIQQSGAVWMSEAKPIESLSDDFLFPMTTSRLSYASSPESDLELSPGPSTSLPLGNLPQLVKSNSDPSIATNQDILDRDRHILGDGLPPPYTIPYDPVGNQSLISGNIDESIGAAVNANGVRSQSIYGMNAPDLPPRIDRQSKPPGSGEVLPIVPNNPNSTMGRLANQEQRTFENIEADYITRNSNAPNNTTNIMSAGHDVVERHHTSLERQARINAAQMKMASSNLSASQPTTSYDSVSNYDSYNTSQLTAQNLGRLGPNAPDDLKSVPNTNVNRPAPNIEMNLQQQAEYGRTTHEHRQSFVAHGDLKRQNSPIRPSFHEKNPTRTIDTVGGQRPTNLILDGSPRKMETKTDYGKYSNRSNSTSQADYTKVPKNTIGGSGHLIVTPPNGSSGNNTLNGCNPMTNSSSSSSIPFKPVPPPKPKNYKPPLPNANNGKINNQWEKNESVSPCSPQGFYYSSTSGHHHYAPQTPNTPHHSHSTNPANIPPKYGSNSSYGPPTIPHHPSGSNYSSNASSSHHYNGGSGTGPYIAPHRAVPPTLMNMQPHTPERNALDLAGSREQRGSAFELYRKPQIDTSSHHNIMSKMEEYYHHLPQYRQNASLYDDTIAHQRHLLPPAPPLIQQSVNPNSANYLHNMTSSQLTEENYRYNNCYTDLSNNNKDMQFMMHNIDNTGIVGVLPPPPLPPPPLPPTKTKKKSVIKGSFNVIKNALIKTTRPLRRLNSLKGPEHKTKYLRRQHSMLERSIPRPMYPSEYPVYPLHLLHPADAAGFPNDSQHRQYEIHPENNAMNSAELTPTHYRNNHHYGNHMNNSTYQNLENDDIYGCYMDPMSMPTVAKGGYIYDYDDLYANRARIDLERRQAEALKFSEKCNGKKIFRRHSTTTVDRKYLHKTEPTVALSDNYSGVNVGQSKVNDNASHDRCSKAPNSEILARRSFRLDLRNTYSRGMQEPVYQSRREMQLNHLQQTKLEMKERILQGKRDIERDLTHQLYSEYDTHNKESTHQIRRDLKGDASEGVTSDYNDHIYQTQTNETLMNFSETINGRPEPIYETKEEESILETKESHNDQENEKEDKTEFLEPTASLINRPESLDDSCKTIIEENGSAQNNNTNNGNSANIIQVVCDTNAPSKDKLGEIDLDTKTVHNFDKSNMPTIMESQGNHSIKMEETAATGEFIPMSTNLQINRVIAPTMPTMPIIDENDPNIMEYPSTSHKLPSAVNGRKLKTPFDISNIAKHNEPSHMRRNDSNMSVEAQYTSQVSLSVGPPNATSTPYTSNVSLPLAGPVALNSQFTKSKSSTTAATFPAIPKEPTTTRGYFDSNGGTLVDRLWNVSLIIPPGAIPAGVRQEIYFTVSDPRLGQAVNGPPLDMENGETMLSPLVMCGPQGLEFLQPVTLNIPHCAGHTPSLGVALKATDSEKNLHTEWENMDLPSNADAHTVSVKVDHF